MTLTLRPTGLSSDPDHNDWTVHEDGRAQPIGRIYEDTAARSEEVRWFWAIQIIGAHEAGVPMTGRARTFDEAKADFRRNLGRYQYWSSKCPVRTRPPSEAGPVA